MARSAGNNGVGTAFRGDRSAVEPEGVKNPSDRMSVFFFFFLVVPRNISTLQKLFASEGLNHRLKQKLSTFISAGKRDP